RRAIRYIRTCAVHFSIMRTQTRHLRIVTPAAAPGKASRALATTSAGIVGAVGFGALAIVFDQLCELFKRREMKHCEALSDGAAHIATALAVSIPAMPFVEHKARLAVLATLSAVAIDLDHLVAARS